MEVFKEILRQSIGLKAERLVLLVGQVPQISFGKKFEILDQFPLIKVNWLESLFPFLFPQDSGPISKGQPVKGTLGISNLGTILLLLKRTDQYNLTLYFPGQGEAIFFKDWEEAQKREASSPPQNNQVAERVEPIHQIVKPPPPVPIVESEEESAIVEFRVQGEDSSAALMQMDDEDSTMFISEKESVGENALVKAPQAKVESSPAPIKHQFDENAIVHQNKDSNVFKFQASAVDDSIFDILGSAPDDANRSILDEYSLPEGHPGDSKYSSHSQRSGAGRIGVKDTMSKEELLQKSFTEDVARQIPISEGNNLIDKLLSRMVALKASDLHLTIGQPPIFRISGDIVREKDSNLGSKDLRALFEPIMPMNNLLEYSEGFDTDFAYEVRNLGRFRINLFKNNVGVAAVLRLIPDKIPTLEDIHAPDVFMNFCDLAKGLVLVTGPTGSGKSTTLAAMIDHINKSRSDHIITIEDPIEFVHAQKQCLVNQREVGRHTSTFSRALRAALREDPDVILVGEMRDLETISMALESAETGHLVFGTLHTNTAVATIDRIIDIFPGDQQQQVRSMLATTLKGVVCQTLMKNRKGGRVAAYEILVSSDAVSTMIREGKSHMIQNHMLTQKSDGNLTFNESLVALLADQSISLTDALSYAGDKKSLINLAKRRGVSINLDQINPADKLLLAN